MLFSSFSFILSFIAPSLSNKNNNISYSYNPIKNVIGTDITTKKKKKKTETETA